MKIHLVYPVMYISIMALSLTIFNSMIGFNANASNLDLSGFEETGGDEDSMIVEEESSNFDSIESANIAIDSATLEQIRQAIMYGPNSEDVEDKSPTVTPETPAEYSTGRIHVKMKPGNRLEKTDGVSSLCDAAGKSIDAEVLHWCYQYIE